MVVDVLVPWIALNDVALSILLGDIVHEVPIVHNKLNRLVSHFSENIFIVLLAAIAIIFICILRVKRPVSDLEKTAPDQLIRELCPHIALELGVSLLSHGGLNHRGDDTVTLALKLRLEEAVGLEVGHLGILVEGVH